ncbi:anti-sigma factor [Nocardioides solisilvae]|uniref:anti-sigma factor n=1 Tax=Nocardioides solisilvae TaxID=1542435 RepID=UPI000D746BED|nr:anti-sigma factor [Nocardioides solisilvae]
MSDSSTARKAEVELRLPADGAYASVLRTTTAGLAARLDFTLDDIEDLRIAIGEASAMVLPEADPDSDLTCRFFLDPHAMAIEISVQSSHPPESDTDSFAWQVLSTLAGETEVYSDDGQLTVRLSMASSVGEPDL